MASSTLLDQVESPSDLRALSYAELDQLAKEIRIRLTEVVLRNGGHLASNLGVVELTLALHRVYDFAQDRLLLDVGHQCYVHKLLTGRRNRFSTLRQWGGISGFPNPSESPYDPFVVGHASTSISVGLGLAIGYRQRKESRHAVVVIGDGAIAGGMAFEAMNQAGHSREDLLVILNDNEMSIAKTVGAFHTYLTTLRTRPETQKLREEIRQLLHMIPLIGGSLEWVQERILDLVKGRGTPSDLFSALGFHYFGIVDGHDLRHLEEELRNLKQLRGPRLLHIRTEKGRGFDPAATDPETYHATVPYEIKVNGDLAPRAGAPKMYTDIFVDRLIEHARQDERIVAITAAMPAGTGLKKMASLFPDRCFDVGICEEHSVAFAAGLARAGLRPVVAIYSTFLQRGYDQVIHDVALQPSLPVIFAIDRAGLVGADGPTHHGVFDIAYLRHIPGMILMAPRDGEELEAMLDFALSCESPVAIRYPRGRPLGILPSSWTPIVCGKSEMLRKGKDGTILAYGRMVEAAYQAAAIASQRGIELTVVNARFVKPLDEEMILEQARSSPILFTIEDHVLAGGFGSAVAECLCDHGVVCRLLRIGLPDRFIPHGKINELDRLCGLDPESLATRFCEAVRKGSL